MTVCGQLTINPCSHCRVTWRIALGVNNSRHDVSVVESEWGYLTEASALAAARRWAKRLHIKLQEDQ